MLRASSGYAVQECYAKAFQAIGVAAPCDCLMTTEHAQQACKPVHMGCRKHLAPQQAHPGHEASRVPMNVCKASASAVALMTRLPSITAARRQPVLSRDLQLSQA